MNVSATPNVEGTSEAISPPMSIELDSEDHVMWQSSQTPCVALKQLLHTPDEGVRVSRGWQRESSFEQIPGFSRLVDNDVPTPSSSSTRVPVRPRRSQSPAIIPDVAISELPFNPDILDFMKNVSAQLAQNVRVQSTSSLGPERTKTERRTRSTTTPLQSARPKKNRLEALRGAELVQTPVDKGKTRAQAIKNPKMASPSMSQAFTSSQLQMPPPPGPSTRRDTSVQAPLPAKRNEQPTHPKQSCLPQQMPPPVTRGMKPQISQASLHKTVRIDRPAEPIIDKRYSHTPPTSTPNVPTSSQSARPPCLGMRRTNTFPMATSLQKTGDLPTRQKGFKPPLLSSSQPQLSSQNAKYTAFRTKPSTEGSFSSDSPYGSASSSSTTHTSASSRSSRHSASPAAIGYAPEVAPRPPASIADAVGCDVDEPAIDSLPEPLDCDPDSSFGDMSFDIDADALEATMKLYD